MSLRVARRLVIILLAVALLVGLGVGALLLRPRLQQASDPALRPTAQTRLRATFLGTSSVVIDDGRWSVIIDGFLTRPGLATLLTEPLRSLPERVEPVLARVLRGQPLGLFVAHSHFDHVLDAATVARQTGAVVYGSPSTARLMEAEGLDEGSHRTLGEEAVGLETFSVRAHPTPHSLPERLAGPIEAISLPARTDEYKAGQNFSFLIRHEAADVLIVPSGNSEADTFAGIRADVVFLGVGQLGLQGESIARTLWCRAVYATGAKVVIPVHWDDFTRPLRAPLPATPYLLDRVDRSLAWLGAFARADGVRFVRLDAFESVDLEAARRVPRPQPGGDLPLCRGNTR